VWLTHLNQIRALAGAGPVAEDATLSAADTKHVTFMLANGLTHAEWPSGAGYTPAGAAAGLASNLALTWGAPDDNTALDTWATAPYHAVWMLDPTLTSVGYADGYSPAGDYSMYALDVQTNRANSDGATFTYPRGNQVPYTSYSGGEDPDPLSYCPNLTAGQVGAPVIATFPGHTNAPSSATLTATTSTGNTYPVEVCVLSADQEVGDYGVVMMPNGQLVPGTSYRAVISVDGITKDWTFALPKKNVTLSYNMVGTVYYGQPTQIYAGALGADDGSTVTVDYQVPGQSAWTRVGTPAVSYGSFNFAFTPPGAQVTFRFAYAGTASANPATATFTEPFASPDTGSTGGTGAGTGTGSLGIRHVAGWITAGTTWIRAHRYKIDPVTVRPGFGTVQLVRSRTRTGTYTVVVSVTVNSDHVARIRVPARAGFYQVRVPACGGYGATVSGAKKVSVRH
jgi:hypothetical protein